MKSSFIWILKIKCVQNQLPMYFGTAMINIEIFKGYESHPHTRTSNF